MCWWIVLVVRFCGDSRRMCSSRTGRPNRQWPLRRECCQLWSWADEKLTNAWLLEWCFRPSSLWLLAMALGAYWLGNWDQYSLWDDDSFKVCCPGQKKTLSRSIQVAPFWLCTGLLEMILSHIPMIPSIPWAAVGRRSCEHKIIAKRKELCVTFYQKRATFLPEFCGIKEVQRSEKYLKSLLKWALHTKFRDDRSMKSFMNSRDQRNLWSPKNRTLYLFSCPVWPFFLSKISYSL